jgi:hypothetical protein
MVEYTYLELFLFCTSVLGLAFSLKYKEEVRSHRRFISLIFENKEAREKFLKYADETTAQAREEGIV